MTTVKLFKDIGLDPTFKKTIDFTTKSAQLDWFNSKQYQLYTDVNYNKLQNTLKINTGVSFSESLTFTYALIQDMETDDRDYFCFVDGVTLISENVVEFSLVLDPIQTFMTEFTIGESMVNREHVDRWSKQSNRTKYNFPQPDSTLGEQTQTYSNKIPTPNYGLVSIVFVGYGLGEEAGKSVNYGFFPVKFDNPDYRYPTKVSISSYSDGSITQTIVKDATFPSLNDVIYGTFINNFNIASDAIQSVTITKYPSLELIDNTGWFNLISADLNKFDVEISTNPVKITINRMDMLITNGLNSDNPVVIQILNNDAIKSISKKSVHLTNLGLPEKPANNALADAKYEPALYMEPYMNRYITDGKGKLLTKIPDNRWLGNQGNGLIYYQTVFTGSGMSDILMLGLTLSGEDLPVEYGSDGTSIENPCQNLDVATSQWRDYVLTQRDTDRKMVSDNNWKNAIDNVIFMGYGGSLVASRGASGRDSGERRQQNIKSMVPMAIGLSIGTGVLTSVVDSHYAWEAQRAKEQQIRNMPGKIISEGSGIQGIIAGFNDYYVTETSVDNINWFQAYDNFRKYGYMVNHYETPNIRSRKYFNYILTSGCIIEGSLNTEIKEAIATIFNNGITIFHGDYTNTLTYPIYENIERELIT